MVLTDKRSTVTPGQLPTLAEDPLILLNRVDLPVLGMPIKATLFIDFEVGYILLFEFVQQCWSAA